MEKLYKIAGYRRWFTRSGIKNHIRYYGIEDKNVEIYGLILLDSIPVSDWNGSIQFYAAELRDTDIQVLISSETITEALEKFFDYLQDHYPALSVSAEEVNIVKIPYIR
jgi:hypothetical protein